MASFALNRIDDKYFDNLLDNIGNVCWGKIRAGVPRKEQMYFLCWKSSERAIRNQ